MRTNIHQFTINGTEMLFEGDEKYRYAIYYKESSSSVIDVVTNNYICLTKLVSTCQFTVYGHYEEQSSPITDFYGMNRSIHSDIVTNNGER